MPHQITTFYWSTSSFSGTGQLNEGPFHVGVVHKFFRAEIRGVCNFQGVVFGPTSVEANFPAWCLQWGPHGYTAYDTVSSGDGDNFLARRQVGSEDMNTAWPDGTTNSALIRTWSIADDWAGQLAIGADTDMYLTLRSSQGQSLDNFNTFGTFRVWWI